VLSPQETMPKAKAAAMTALAIDPKLAEAYAPLGRIRAEYDWNWSMAEQDFKRAIELNPGYSTARHWYATYLTFMGRFDEALAEIQRAQQSDPLSLMINAQVGWVFFQRRQYDQAIEQLQKTIAMDSSFYFGHFILGRAYTHKGNFAQAVIEFERAWQLEKNPFILGYLGHANALSGNRREAERLLTELQQLKKQRYVRATSLANIYIGLQDKNQAFAWLEKAREEGSGTLILLKVDPMFDSLRSDARFALLLRKIGLGT
jgi:tetratricopeptide (TPR) repeat protein